MASCSRMRDIRDSENSKEYHKKCLSHDLQVCKLWDFLFGQCIIEEMDEGRNMWTITSIEEDDCDNEERMPGMPKRMLVTVEDDFGREITLECADSWLASQELAEGDEWPEDMVEFENAGINLSNMLPSGMAYSQMALNEMAYNQIAPSQVDPTDMAAWMDNYYRALEELEDEE